MLLCCPRPLSIVISPHNAAVSPYTMPLCIWASTMSGLTTGPQSTAQTTRCTRTAPSDATETSATSATHVSNDLYTASPRARPAGGAGPPPPLLPARVNNPRGRGALVGRAPPYPQGARLPAGAPP